MKTRSMLGSLSMMVGIRLGCALVILTMATMVMASSGTPTVNGLFYGDGDQYNYNFLGEDLGRGKLYYKRVGDTLYLAMVVSQTVNDNVFGWSQQQGDPDRYYVGTANWVHHQAENLIKSDHVELTLQCGSMSWNWRQDYVYDSDGDSDPRESDWLSGPDGPDGNNANPPPGLVSASSLQYNLNNSSWDVTLGDSNRLVWDDKKGEYKAERWKSPDANTINDVTDDGWPTYNNTYGWEWAMVYEMSMDVSACGTNPIVVYVPSAHNSPSKDRIRDVPICTSGCSLPASIGDYVWVDTDGDGVQDAGELGLDGVTVKLYDSSNNLVDTTTTSGGGAYNFTGLTPGDYYVEFVLPAGYAFSPQDQGGDDALDSDADTTTGKTAVTTLVSGENDTTWDAGLRPICSQGGLISGVVYEDNTPTGGGQGPEDPGIAGATVRLYEDLDPVGTKGAEDPQVAITTTTTTPVTGSFQFGPLPPGNYIITQDQINGYNAPSPSERFTQLLCAAGGSSGNDFGNTPQTPTAVTLANFDAVTLDSRSSMALPLALAGIAMIAIGGLSLGRRRW